MSKHVSMRTGTHLHTVVSYIHNNPGCTVSQLVAGSGLEREQVRNAIVRGRDGGHIAMSFRGVLVLRTKGNWSRAWADLSNSEKRIVRRIRAKGGATSFSDLADHTGWSENTLRVYLHPLRRDNILVRSGALFLGPNFNKEE